MSFRKNKVALVSDLHFGVHQSSNMWHNIALDFAKWFKDELKKNKIQDIIICGDVNNDRNEISVHTLSVVTEIFRIWEEFNIKILIGNHDAYYKDRCDVHSLAQFSGWSNIEIIDDLKVMEQFDKKIGFVPWSKNFSDLPKCDIVFGHCEISGFRMHQNKICVGGVDSHDVLSTAPVVVSGHFHTREERKYKQGKILYLGCPYELNWNDYNAVKGFYLLDFNDMSTEFIENNVTPKHKKISLTEIIKSGDISSFKDIMKDNIICFVVDQNVSTDKLDKLIAKLCSYGPKTFKTDFNVSQLNTGELELETTGVDVLTSIQEFIGLLDIKNKKDVSEYMNELYKRVVA